MNDAKKTYFKSRNGDIKRKQREKEMYPHRREKQIILPRLQNFQAFAFTDDKISHSKGCGQQLILSMISQVMQNLWFDGIFM